MDSVTRWAKMVHGQPNPNIDIGEELRNEWFDVEKAMSSNGKVKPKGSAYSFFEKAYHGNEKKVFKDRPFTFTASHFGLTDKDVPLNAYVTRVTFKVTMKVQGTIDVRVPRARFNLYGGKDIDALMEDGTGWDGSKYNHSPTGKITTKLKEVSYTMNETEFHKAGFKVNALFSDRFGVDLLWYKPNSQKSENKIYIQSIGVTVDYVLPNHLITFDYVTDGNNPRYVDVGEEYSVKITHANDSKADDNDKKIKIAIPSDIEVLGVTGNYNNNIWTVKGKHKSKNELILKLKNWDNGLKKISLLEKDIGNYDYYIYGVPRLTDIGDVKCYAHDIHKGHKEYVDFKVRAYSPDDNQIKFNVNVDENKPDIKVEWEILEVNDVNINVPITDVSIDETSTDTLIVFNIPQNIAKDIMFRGYFITHETGEKTAKIENYTCKYTVLPPYTYIFSNNGVTEEDCFNLICNPNRTRSRFYRGMLETTLQTPIIECPFVHNLMEIGEGKITASIFDKKNYIGKVQLKKITHCNPKSKLTNKLIRESGKNHLILGKEGDIDESISFTTYVRPADSVTLQGYAELDEPTPINANHDCFEGDPLNHRGWAEIESVDIEQTNPLWYKVDLDVTYITHDINTKFEIVKGKSEKGDLPELFATIFELGEDLSESDVFMVDTDGGFVYDENEGEIEDNNIFTLANNQKLEIRTVKPLSSVFEIVFDWKTLKDNEDSQNKMSRIFKLIDNNTGNSVMEYEYTDLEFTYKDGLDHTPDNLEFITCDAILRVMNKDMGQNPQTHNMELHYDFSKSDESLEEDDEILFGSSLRITSIIINQLKYP